MNAHSNMKSPPEQHQIPEPLPTYNATDLTKGGVQAQIVLNAQIYSLRITRAGKLILTK